MVHLSLLRSFYLGKFSGLTGTGAMNTQTYPTFPVNIWPKNLNGRSATDTFCASLGREPAVLSSDPLTCFAGWSVLVLEPN